MRSNQSPCPTPLAYAAYPAYVAQE